ncbi:hypothetical protein [Granulosicoccus antarcticus]|uniref:Uncharacterized protein n=1 Tax=Granulosicoccus antarcticus IMCC3135 TaxID=1192854 RepID=A0A2Z2NGM8_9GAMM|nr:hypothetical protein [Granulosicoccus antarcticus]ASJ70213.1 hypothetical protein IMCC3135_00435 [Granulosicoccus antarcticus IMCC3135]
MRNTSRRRYRSSAAGADPFTDLLFNILLGFILLFFLAILFINPAEKTGKIDIDAQYVVTVSWPDGSADDIDTWILDPSGSTMWFRNKSSNLVHLDRDDRGMLNDTLQINGVEVQTPLNQEIVAIRGVMPGEYIVNVHYYQSESSLPVPVWVKVAKVNPVYTVAYYGQTLLDFKGEEKTAVRFTVASNGSISNINQLPKSLVPK